MLLTSENICHYLLEKELIKKETVVDGDFVTVAIPTRNNLYKVISATDKNLFIKQVSSFGLTETGILRKEAGAYQFIRNNKAYAALADNLPGFISYDDKRHVLVTEYFLNATSTHDYCVKQKIFPVALAREQATILASYHFPADKNADTTAFPKSIPWVLQLNDFGPYEIFPHSKTNGELISVIQNHPELKAMLSSLKKDWEFSSLIHGDIKWINFIVTHQEQGIKQYLIDWELADIGDPCWDVAGIIQSYLAAWIFSFDNQNARSMQLNSNMMAFDLEHMQPAIGHFWDEYSKRMQLSTADNKTMLTKVMKYTAARMIQTAIEGVVYDPRIFPNNMRSIQIAHNILKTPAIAVKELLGITI